MANKTKSSRKGDTWVTSVSISKNFKKLLDKYEVSHSEVMRKGIAIELYERGEARYYNPLNRRRFEALKKMFDIDKLKNINKIIKNLQEELTQLKEILDLFEEYG